MVDKALIFQALDDLGYKYEEGDLEIEGSRGNKTKINIKIFTRFGNDIGLMENNGIYEIIADWWGVLGITQKAFSDGLNQRYAYLAVKTRLEQQGFTLASEENNGGKIHLVLRRMG